MKTTNQKKKISFGSFYFLEQDKFGISGRTKSSILIQLIDSGHLSW